jgi:hypothetical protein
MSLDDFKDNSRKNLKTWSKEDIKDGVKNLYIEIGEVPTMRDATNHDELPSSATITNKFGTWNNLLEEIGLEKNQVEKYTDEDKEDMLNDIRRCADEINSNLTTREYINIGSFGHNAIKNMFGSWGEALEEAGVKSGQKHGSTTQCKCGETLDSVNEKIVGDILHQFSINHEVHKSLPQSDYISDFYLPSISIWIEVNGYEKSERPNQEQYNQKLNHYELLGLEYIEINVPYNTKQEKIKQKIEEVT